MIPLLLVIVGIFVWGLQYKLSLYDPPGSPSRSIAQAKLLSPNERLDSVRATAQIHPPVLPQAPLLFLTFLIAAVDLRLLSIRQVRAQASASQDVEHTFDSVSSFFFFRPPPAYPLAQ